jgi:hypothetical protein
MGFPEYLRIILGSEVKVSASALEDADALNVNDNSIADLTRVFMDSFEAR